MSDLKDEIADLAEKIADEVRTYERGLENPLDIAYRILAIPEIAEALLVARYGITEVNVDAMSEEELAAFTSPITVHRD